MVWKQFSFNPLPLGRWRIVCRSTHYFKRCELLRSISRSIFIDNQTISINWKNSFEKEKKHALHLPLVEVYKLVRGILLCTTYTYLFFQNKDWEILILQRQLSTLIVIAIVYCRSITILAFTSISGEADKDKKRKWLFSAFDLKRIELCKRSFLLPSTPSITIIQVHYFVVRKLMENLENVSLSIHLLSRSSF